MIKEWKKSREKFYEFLKKILFALTMMFFMIQIVYAVINTIAQIKDSSKELLMANGFVDTRLAASRFETCLRLKAFNTGIAILMMSIMLNHKITQKFTVEIINQTVIKNIQYLVLVIPVFVGMALVGMMIFGPFDSKYADFDKAMVSVMLFTIGQIGNPTVTQNLAPSCNTIQVRH